MYTNSSFTSFSFKLNVFTRSVTGNMEVDGVALTQSDGQCLSKC
jgi:hypothetical protein